MRDKPMATEVVYLRADLAKAREEVARLTREREDYREKRANEVAAAERARDEAVTALRAATKCDCGRDLGRGRCNVCDNDE